LKSGLGYYEARRGMYKGSFLRALRPTDVWLLGHPKSGNTWLAYMLAVLLFRDSDDAVNLQNVATYVPFIHGRDHRIRQHGHLPDPRIFRNEWPEYLELYPQIIYLVRDPRAVLLSLWHMYRVMMDDRDLSLDSFLTQYMGGSGIFLSWNYKLQRWDRQVREMVDRAGSDPRIMILKYEEMVLDRKICLERLVGFLDVSRTEGEIDRAFRRGNFEEMQRIEDRHGAEAYEGRAKGEGKFVRAGKIEGWREEMDPALAARIEEELGPAMKLTEYL
jgi:hypothetical protein